MPEVSRCSSIWFSVEKLFYFRICDPNRAKFISEFDCWWCPVVDYISRCYSFISTFGNNDWFNYGIRIADSIDYRPSGQFIRFWTFISSHLGLWPCPDLPQICHSQSKSEEDWNDNGRTKSKFFFEWTHDTHVCTVTCSKIMELTMRQSSKFIFKWPWFGYL